MTARGDIEGGAMTFLEQKVHKSPYYSVHTALVGYTAYYKSRTKILKIWFSWGEERPNVQLNLRSLDDYFLPGESSLYLRSRRRHKKSGRHKSRHNTSCSCHNKRGCVECSRLRSLEEVVKLVVSQERKIQELGDRIYATDRLIDRHESRIHHHRVQQNGQDYVQNSYLNSHSSESSSSLDCSSFSSLDLKDLGAIFRESSLQELEEISRLCDDLAHVERRLGEEQTKIKEMTPEIERLTNEMGLVAEMEGEANAELECTRTEMIRAVTLHVTNEYNERELDRKMDLCLDQLNAKSQTVKEIQDELSRCEERLGAADVTEMLDSGRLADDAAAAVNPPAHPSPSQTWRRSPDTSPLPLYKETYRPFERGWSQQFSNHPHRPVGNNHQSSFSANSNHNIAYSTNSQQSNSNYTNHQQWNSDPPNHQQWNSNPPNQQQSTSNLTYSAGRQLSTSDSRQTNPYSPSHEHTGPPWYPIFQKTDSPNLPTTGHSKDSASDTRVHVQKKSVTFSQDLEDNVFTDDSDSFTKDVERNNKSMDSSYTIKTTPHGSVDFRNESNSNHYANVDPFSCDRPTDPSSLNRVTFSRDSRPAVRRNEMGKTSDGFKNRSRSADRSPGFSEAKVPAQITHSENGGSNWTGHRSYDSHVVNQYVLESSDQPDFRRNNLQSQISTGGYQKAARNLKKPDEGQGYTVDRSETRPLHSKNSSAGYKNDETQIPKRDGQLFKYDKPDMKSSTNTHAQAINGQVHGGVPGMQQSARREMPDTSGPVHNGSPLFDQNISDHRFNNDGVSPRFSSNGVAGMGSRGRGRAEDSPEHFFNSAQGHKQKTDQTNAVGAAGTPRSTEAHVRHGSTMPERGGRRDVPGGTPNSNKQEVISTKQQTDVRSGLQTSDALAGRQRNEQTQAPTAVTDHRAPRGIHWTHPHVRPSSGPTHGEHGDSPHDSNHVHSLYNGLPSTTTASHGNSFMYGGDEPRAVTESKSSRNYDTAHGEPAHGGKFEIFPGSDQLFSNASSSDEIKGGMSNGGRGALYHIVSNKMNRAKNDQGSSRQITDRSESSSSEPSAPVSNTGSNLETRQTAGAAKPSHGTSATSAVKQSARDKYSDSFIHKSHSSPVNCSTSLTYHHQVSKHDGSHNQGGTTLPKDFEGVSPKGSNPYFPPHNSRKNDANVSVAGADVNVIPRNIFEEHYRHQTHSEFKPRPEPTAHVQTAKHSTATDPKRVLTVNLNDIPVTNHKQAGTNARDFNFINGVTNRHLITNGHGVIRTKVEDTNDSNSDTGLSSMHSDETANMETLV